MENGLFPFQKEENLLCALMESDLKCEWIMNIAEFNNIVYICFEKEAATCQELYEPFIVNIPWWGLMIKRLPKEKKMCIVSDCIW